MKAAIILEFGDKIEELLPYNYICETLINIFYYLDDDEDMLDAYQYDKAITEGIEIKEPRELYKELPTPYDRLTFSQQRNLKEYGYDKECFNSFKSMYDKVYKWAMIKGFPYNRYVLSADEYEKWKQLTNICNIINFA